MREIDPDAVGTLTLDGMRLPLVHLDEGAINTRLRLRGTEYAFQKSYLVRGFGATMPADVATAMQRGRRPLIVERGDRYYLYLA